MRAASAVKIRPRVLVVGQTPPPYGGQAIMIKYLLDAPFERVELVHVRMAFSRHMAEMGHVRLTKVLFLPQMALRIIRERVTKGTDILYYPPAGGDGVAVYRDIALLLLVRPFFKKTIFHFHAAGISEKYKGFPPTARWLFRRACLRPDAAIIMSKETIADADILQAFKTVVIPYGIPDPRSEFRENADGRNKPPMVLYAGVLRESKGVGVLIEALGNLKRRNVPFRACLMGEFVSAEYERQLKTRVLSLGISEAVEFAGVLVGSNKWKRFSSAAIFCFPTFFESEAFPVSILEAMAFGKPVVAADWRGIRAEVRDGQTGFLVPIRDPVTLADRLQCLIQNSELAFSMGRAAREVYEREYTFEMFARRMEDLFVEVACSA